MIDPILLRGTQGPAETRPLRPPAAPAGPGFQSVLREAVQNTREVKFSSHALQRLSSRGIALTAEQTQRLEKAVTEASAKGARESLFLMDGLALVVSVPNRTVITALEPEAGENSVFTNIDSAVVVAAATKSQNKTETFGLDPFGGSPVAADRLTRPTTTGR